MKIAYGFFAMMVLTACGASESARSTMLRETLASDDVRRARTYAPDLVAAAEQAHAQARAYERAENPEAASDEETRARLLIAAALAESNRADADERRLVIEHETQELVVASESAEQQRLEIQHENARLSAARTAQEELSRALAQAERDEPRRRGLVSSSASNRAPEADAIARRARMDLAVAIALGADERTVNAAREALDHVDAETRDSAARLGAAYAARRAAEFALGRARASSAMPNADAVASLAATARDYGFTVESTPRGLVVIVPRFDARAAARVADLATSFAVGPLLIEGRGRAQDTNTQRVAAAIASELARANVPSTRVSVASPSESSQSADTSIAIVFAAYGVRPNSPTPSQSSSPPAVP